MTTQPTEPAATEPTQEPTTEPNEQDPKPTETVEFWKRQAREQEKRAKDNVAAAQRLKEIEDAQKSDAEKAQARIADLEASIPTAVTNAFREAAVAFGGVTREDADLLLTGTDTETLFKQAQAIGARAEDQKKGGNVVPTAGKKPGNPQDADAVAMNDFLSQLTS